MTSVVVPEEPTVEMNAAGADVCDIGMDNAADVYRAMLAARPKPPADLVRAVIHATDDGDHHPPISQWAAERAVEVVMGARPAPTVEEVLDAADKYLLEQYGFGILGNPADRARIHALWAGEKA